MKVALLTDGISPYVMGGMQKHSYYLAKYLAQNKVYVDLYHFNQSNSDIHKLDVFSNDEKEFIRSIVIDFPKLDSLPGHYLRESYKYSELIFSHIKPALNGYDFIYSKGFSGWKLIEEKTKGLACPPIGVKFHGYEMFQPAPDIKTFFRHLLLRGPVKSISRKADFVFSYGSKITGIIRKLGVSKTKIIEIPTGIENNWLNSSKLGVGEIRRFVFVGRFERRKGVEELTAVIKDLINNYPFVFEFIGPIPKEMQIQGKNIVYHGSISDAEKIKTILRGADVFVCPSHSEGMPNVILEGMASGLAIIATDVGAVSLMVGKHNGCLISPGSKQELSKAMVDLINMDTTQFIGLKENSIKIVQEKFLWNNVIKSLIPLIVK